MFSCLLMNHLQPYFVQDNLIEESSICEASNPPFSTMANLGRDSSDSELEELNPETKQAID